MANPFGYDVVPFGEERVDVISASKMEELSETYKDPFKFAYSIMKEIYFNHDVKTNNNVRYVKLSNKKTIMVVWTGQTWKEFPDEDILHDMFISYEKAKAIHDPPNEETQKAIDAMERRVKF